MGHVLLYIEYIDMGHMVYRPCSTVFIVYIHGPWSTVYI